MIQRGIRRRISIDGNSVPTSQAEGIHVGTDMSHDSYKIIEVINAQVRVRNWRTLEKKHNNPQDPGQVPKIAKVTLEAEQEVAEGVFQGTRGLDLQKLLWILVVSTKALLSVEGKQRVSHQVIEKFFPMTGHIVIVK